MTIPSIFKKKSFYIVLVILALGGYWLWARSQAAGKITYETTDATQGTLMQTVEVTGEIKPAARIDLAFKTGGTLQNIAVKVGDAVKKGDGLAQLEANDLTFAVQRAQAALAVAQANLDLRLAGETAESIQVAQASVDQAQAAYDKAVSDLANTKIQVQNDSNSAQIALQTAQNNLNNSQPISSQVVTNAIETSRITLKNALGPLNTALTDGDTISGVDDTASNQLYKSYLGAFSQGSMDLARAAYQKAKTDKLSAEQAVNALSSSSTQDDVLAAADKIQTAIESIQAYLLDVKVVLANSITSTYFSATDLAAKRTTIDADLLSVSTQKTTVAGARQAIQNAALSNTSDVAKLQDAVKTAQVAYDSAQTDIKMKIAAAESAVAVQKAALQSAQAALQLKKAPPRAVDLASLRATVLDSQVALAQAQDGLNNARIIAPVDGLISEILSDTGEHITPETVQIRMVGTATYDIEAKVPEADIAKIKIGQESTFTLDAYGEDVKFTGTVTSIDPDEVKVQDAVYYNIRATIADTDKVIKPGMTANLTITTGKVENAIIIPLRAIKTVGNAKTVSILLNGKPVDKDVTLGLQGDEGQVQVLTGLEKGDKVILSQTQG